jgi:hypothetical protein
MGEVDERVKSEQDTLKNVMLGLFREVDTKANTKVGFVVQGCYVCTHATEGASRHTMPAEQDHKVHQSAQGVLDMTRHSVPMAGIAGQVLLPCYSYHCSGILLQTISDKSCASKAGTTPWSVCL